jgi:hypothetical protein
VLLVSDKKDVLLLQLLLLFSYKKYTVVAVGATGLRKKL